MRATRVLGTLGATTLAIGSLVLLAPAAQAVALTSCYIGNEAVTTPQGSQSNVAIGVGNTFGYNVIQVADGGALVVGTANADLILGTNGPDKISGGGGNDLICGGGGNDFLGAQQGNLSDAGGANQAGNDYYVGGADSSDAGREVFAGADRIVDTSGTNKLFGGGGNDLLTGGPLGAGGSGNDFVSANVFSVTPVTLLGEAGNDLLIGGLGGDVLVGGPGTDSLSGSSGIDILSGAEGNDTLNGGSSGDTLAGDAGNDVLRGGSGNDALSGGDGDDDLDGESGTNTNNGGPNTPTGDKCVNPNTAGGATNCEL